MLTADASESHPESHFCCLPASRRLARVPLGSLTRVTFDEHMVQDHCHLLSCPHSGRRFTVRCHYILLHVLCLTRLFIALTRVYQSNFSVKQNQSPPFSSHSPSSHTHQPGKPSKLSDTLVQRPSNQQQPNSETAKLQYRIALTLSGTVPPT